MIAPWLFLSMDTVNTAKFYAELIFSFGCSRSRDVFPILNLFDQPLQSPPLYGVMREASTEGIRCKNRMVYKCCFLLLTGVLNNLGDSYSQNEVFVGDHFIGHGLSRPTSSCSTQNLVRHIPNIAWFILLVHEHEYRRRGSTYHRHRVFQD